ncbi:MAG: IS110 family transposase [Rhodanobacteraceae bacterium]
MALNAQFKQRSAQFLAIGIDVSKASLSVHGLLTDGGVDITVRNTPEAVAELMRGLAEAGFGGRIIMESTGYYHWLAAVCGAEAGLDVRLVNPLMSSKHARAAIRKTKTDPVDARQLASMAITEAHLPAPWRRDRNWVALRHKAGLLCALEKMLQRLHATLRDHRAALAIMGVEDDPVVDGLASQIKALKRQCDKAEDDLTACMKAHADRPLHTRLQTVPGISAYVAGLQTLFFRPDVKGPKSWGAFIGIDLSVKQSGTWRGRSKLSKRGNAYLRKRMFQAAWGAMQGNPEFKAYYEHLRAQGRSYKESLLMIARKQLRIAYTLWTQNTTYDPTMLKV